MALENVTPPNLFQPFLKASPTINPNYEEAKEESELWLQK